MTTKTMSAQSGYYQQHRYEDRDKLDELVFNEIALTYLYLRNRIGNAYIIEPALQENEFPFVCDGCPLAVKIETDKWDSMLIVRVEYTYLKLWLDDAREPPDDSWVWVKNFRDAIAQLMFKVYNEVSLDHDLGNEKTGYDVAKWIEENYYYGSLKYAPVIYCHSANPVGRRRIEQVARKVKDLVEVIGR